MAILRAARQRINLTSVVLVLGSAAALLLAVKLGSDYFPRNLQMALIAAAVVAAYPISLVGHRMRSLAIGIILGGALIGVLTLGRNALDSLQAPRVWDFLAFYVDGNVGARGLNFYQAENYRQVFGELAIPIEVSPSFVPEIVDVGFKYPPMTMFLFCWLGLLSFSQAHVIWLALVCATYGLAVWAVARHLLVDGSLTIRLLTSIAIIGLLPASASNLGYEQTNALLLAIGVLCLATESRLRTGLYAALAISVKPIMVFAAGYYFLRARWIALALFIGGLLALLAAASAVFGLETVLDYVRANPIGRVPPWLHTEWVNQSLLSTLLRQADAEVPVSQAIWYPPFLLVGGAVGALSTWLAWRLARNGDKLAFSLLLSAALLLYPGVLKPYGMLMLIPLVQVGMRLWHTKLGIVSFALLIAVVYLVDTGMAFAAHAIVWSATCLWAACSEKLEPYSKGDPNPGSAG